MKSYEEILESLEAFDLTRSFRAADKLAGCSHHTVEQYVALRDDGRLAASAEAQRRPEVDRPAPPRGGPSGSRPSTLRSNRGR